MRVLPMIKSRLKPLILEHNAKRMRDGQKPLSIRDFAEAVNLSPSVITGLNSGRAQRIDFTTMNKLCAFLSCQPGDLFEYIPTTAE